MCTHVWQYTFSKFCLFLSLFLTHIHTLTYPLKRIRTHPEAQGQAAVSESQSDCGVVLRNIEQERMFSFCSCKGILSAPVIILSIYAHLLSPLLHFFMNMFINVNRLLVFDTYFANGTWFWSEKKIYNLWMWSKYTHSYNIGLSPVKYHVRIVTYVTAQFNELVFD